METVQHIENVTVTEDDEVLEFKCTNCGCVNICWPDSLQGERILSTGTGLRKMYGCIKDTRCMCHSTVGENPHRMLMRKTTLKDISERVVLNG